jgi:hypothetical protein
MYQRRKGSPKYSNSGKFVKTQANKTLRSPIDIRLKVCKITSETVHKLPNLFPRNPNIDTYDVVHCCVCMDMNYWVRHDAVAWEKVDNGTACPTICFWSAEISFLKKGKIRARNNIHNVADHGNRSSQLCRSKKISGRSVAFAWVRWKKL